MKSQLTKVSFATLSYQKINPRSPSIVSDFNSYNLTTTATSYNIGNRAVTKKLDLSIDHKTTDYISSFRSFVVDDKMIANGTVTYCFNQADDVSFYGTDNHHHYTTRSSLHYAECIEKDWFSIQNKIPNYLLTGWQSLKVKHSVELEVAPDQKFTARMKVEIASMLIPYNAIVNFQAQDDKGDYLVDSHLIDLANTIFGNGAEVAQLNKITAEIRMQGMITHEALKDVYVDII